MAFQRPRVPQLIKILIGILLLASLGGAILRHSGIDIISYGVLLPERVWQGELWRLVTWQFFEVEPINLVVAALMLYWFGGDLLDHFGQKRFLAFYLGMAAVVGAITCGLARVWPSAMMTPYLGAWPLADALTIAWAVSFPSREIFLFFVARVGGRNLVLFTVGLTALFAIFYGLTPFIPHFTAELLTLVYLGEGRRWYLRWRMQRLQKAGKRYLRAVEDADRAEDRKGPPTTKPPKYLN